MTENLYPDGNPKTRFGMKKPPIWYVPFIAIYQQALVHLQGALKYGHFNWRHSPVSASVYLNAATRHLMAWKEGENVAADSGIHHLAHVAACCNIIMDAERFGTLQDDRSIYNTAMEEFLVDMGKLTERIYKEWGQKPPEADTSRLVMISENKPLNNDYQEK